MVRLLLPVTCLLLSASCKGKAPTPAQQALDAFAGAAARNPVRLPSGLVVEDGPSQLGVTGGEPEEGNVEVCAELVGVLEWVRTKPVSDTALPTGDHRVELLVDLCMRPEGAMSCTRPNTYALTALMRQVGGAWQVAGSTCAAVNSVR